MSINRTEYAYEIHGQGEPVLFLHGFTGSKQTWKPFIQKWKKQFQVIVLDLPGHGLTESETNLSMEQCCHDLSELLSRLKIDSINIVGYSMGGRTALSFAMYYPKKIKSLVLESASPGLEDNDEKKARVRSDEKLAKKIIQEGIKSFIDFWQDIPLFASQKNLPESIRKNIYAERISQSPTGLAQSLRGMGTGNQSSWWDSLVHLTCPVLLIVGALDEKFVTINKLIQSKVMHAKLEVVLNAGHAVHIEQAEIFGKLIEEFIITE